MRQRKEPDMSGYGVNRDFRHRIPTETLFPVGLGATDQHFGQRNRQGQLRWFGNNLWNAQRIFNRLKSTGKCGCGLNVYSQCSTIE